MIKIETFSNVNFSTQGIERKITAALDRAAQGVASDFNAVTATWKRSPKAQIKKDIPSERVIGVDDNRWLWNNSGTRPHRIRPRNARRLAFKSRYTRKTAPGVLSSRAGGASGRIVTAREVQHPGNKANLWNKAAAEKRTPQLVTEVHLAIKSLGG